MIGEAELRQMTPRAYLVNTARGAVVDRRALFRALSEGWIAGAALDVMEFEPPGKDEPLLRLDNVIATPHMAYYSESAIVRLRRQAAEEVRRVLLGDKPKNLLNPEATARPVDSQPSPSLRASP
jgi:D-3-phosphoglycerate dehydrogenase